MKENSNGGSESPQQNDKGPARQQFREQRNGSNGHSQGRSRTNGQAAGPPLDFWVVLEILARRWHWLVICALLVAGGFFYLGWRFIKPQYTAGAQVLRY